MPTELMTDNKVLPIFCPLCNKSLNNKRTLKEIRESSNNDLIPFKCPSKECETSFFISGHATKFKST
jgi:hypothetical protein